MLRAFVLKDLMILKYRFLFALLLVMMALLPMSPKTPRGVLGAFVIYMVVSAYVSQLGILEDRSRTDVLVAMLPVERRDIVRGRYLLMAGLAATMSALYAGPVLAVSPFVPAPIPPQTLLRWWLWGASVPLVMWSVLLPIVFTYGANRSQLALNLGMFVPMIVLMLLGPVLRVPVRSLVAQGVFSSVPFGLGVLGVALALAFLSSLVSTRLYERRDL